MRQWICKK